MEESSTHLWLEEQRLGTISEGFKCAIRGGMFKYGSALVPSCM